MNKETKEPPYLAAAMSLLVFCFVEAMDALHGGCSYGFPYIRIAEALLENCDSVARLVYADSENIPAYTMTDNKERKEERTERMRVFDMLEHYYHDAIRKYGLKASGRFTIANVYEASINLPGDSRAPNDRRMTESCTSTRQWCSRAQAKRSQRTSRDVPRSVATIFLQRSSMISPLGEGANRASLVSTAQTRFSRNAVCQTARYTIVQGPVLREKRKREETGIWFAVQ
jgi:hypothetical protein